MRLARLTAFCTAILLLAPTCSPAVEEGFAPLFDGKTLKGWTIDCLPKDKEFGAKAWTVDQGTILADTMGHKDHFYILLTANKEYGDFVLRLRVRIERNVSGNSGIQIRSRYVAETGWMEGPQIDIDPPNPRGTTGKLWNEGPGEHRWLSNRPVKDAFFRYADEGDGWNDMEITAQGLKITSVLNGVTVVDYDGAGVLDDELHKKHGVGTKGRIGLQIHSNHELRLRFKDIRIKELAPRGADGVPGAGADRTGAATATARPRPIASVKALADRLPCDVDFFDVQGHSAFLIRPKGRATSVPMPWVWYAPVIGHPNTSHAWMLKQWLEKGIGMAGVDVGESHGSPHGRKVYAALWETLVTRYGMAEKACLLPQSRGGLMLYNWAVENPPRVACIAGIYTVCDLRSFPGLEQAGSAYGLSAAELQARLAEHNPIDRLSSLAKAGVPILHVHGDADNLVPLEKNSGELARRYRALGGKMRLIVVPGKGHQVCDEFFQCQELVDFVSAHSEEGSKLFARDDLSGWIEEQHDFYKAQHPSVRTWSLKDGVLACDGSTGNCGFLRYDKKLTDFILRLEYRIAKDCNSGVCIRTPVPYDGRPEKTLPSQVGYEVQILDDAGAAASKTSTGAFYGLVAPRANAARPAGDWNAMEIACRGPKIRVTLNGQVVQDVDQTEIDAIRNRPRAGYLSLQNHGGNIEFRNISLKEEPPVMTPQFKAGPVTFQRHVIDNFPAGYQVAVADLNGDGRPDVIALSTDADRVDWYENPTWQRHPIARTAENIDLAVRDIDGSGRAVIALASGFYFNDAARGGEIQLLRPPAKADELWGRQPIAVDPVVHRLRWGNLDGSGPVLVHAPIFGRGSQGTQAPKPAHLWAFRPPRQADQPWETWKIDESLTVLHGIQVADLDGDGRDEILTASFEGIFRFDFQGQGAAARWRKVQLAAGAPPADDKPGAARGSSEVATFRLAKDRMLLAAIEPWHGHQVVVYSPAEGDGLWQHRVLDDKLREGHALVTGDFDGDGRDEIVAGWRAGGGGLRLYKATDATGRQFQSFDIDPAMPAEGAVAADINGDGKLDLVVLAGRTNQLVWYENRTGGPAKTAK